MYRPENWGELVGELCRQRELLRDTVLGLSERDIKLIETSADAILEALKGQGIKLAAEALPILLSEVSVQITKRSGWLVFIPEE